IAEVDTITVTASGEPTLHADLGLLLSALREMTGKPIAVLTNGTTLSDPGVRADLHKADLVIPSLDSAREDSFRKINRPAPCLSLQTIIKGLHTFCSEFPGRIHLEILFSRAINDHDEDITALLHALSPISLERIQINTVARPPLEAFAKPLSPKRLREIAARLSTLPCSPVVELLSMGQEDSDTLTDYRTARGPETADATDTILILERIIDTIKRRPCTADDITRIFHLENADKVEQLLEPLAVTGKLKRHTHNGILYYQIG
ncbi:MAG: radical SAM protein, partial [Desulfobulbaceae bacterium]|nr:radical SAM protein [Desulfobulbaceae bacterium]